jgi:hypothetical protein
VDRIWAGQDRDLSAGDRAAFMQRLAVASDLREASAGDRFDRSVDRVGAEVDRLDASGDRHAADAERSGVADAPAQRPLH